MLIQLKVNVIKHLIFMKEPIIIIVLILYTLSMIIYVINTWLMNLDSNKIDPLF